MIRMSTSFFRTLFKFSLLFLISSLQLPSTRIFAQNEKQANIKLVFDVQDSIRTCKAIVTSDQVPVKGTEVHFYVKRWYNLLPVGKAMETDDNGEAVATFPNDLPGDKNGNIVAVVKIEDDDVYGTVETQAEINWGILPSKESDHWNERSLSASREKAPMYLIIVSNLIIAVIWATLFYIIFQVYRIKKESRIIKKNL